MSMNSHSQSASLLIYIPTYNRFDRLCEQIDQLYPFLNKYPINILVSNNSSSDERYIGLKDRYPDEKISIITNPVNIGANPNITNGFLYSADYDFLWILSDDDTILGHSIVKIMDLLDKNIDIIYFMMKEIKPGVRECRMSDILEILNFGLGLVSAVIYRSKAVIPDMRIGYEYISSGFPHLAILFASCERKGSLKVFQFHYDEIFLKKKPDPPVESDTYNLSIYGFVHLSDFISERKTKLGFIKMWIIDILPIAISLRKSNRTKYVNLKAYIFAQSKWLFFYFYYRVVISFFLNFAKGVYMMVRGKRIWLPKRFFP
jgi:Glycosyl transferase family 2